jgi:hypothetical protein
MACNSAQWWQSMVVFFNMSGWAWQETTVTVLNLTKTGQRGQSNIKSQWKSMIQITCDNMMSVTWKYLITWMNMDNIVKTSLNMPQNCFHVVHDAQIHNKLQ